MKILLKILLLTLFLSVVIFYINYNFFLIKDKNIENNVAEQLYIDENIQNNQVILSKQEREELSKYIKKISFYKIKYKPYIFKKQTKLFTQNLNLILNNYIFKNKIKNLVIELNEKKYDRRWNMKNHYIRLYWLNKEKEDEYLSVFIHELWHFIDIYFFEKSVFLDISDRFYAISWKKTKILNAHMSQKDFVSWYAMTNKYEDFAESFNFYIFHNKEFLNKLKKSSILKQKYDFFSNYFFKNKEFFATDFGKEKYKNYYWDTTKIVFDKEKFIKYLTWKNK